MTVATPSEPMLPPRRRPWAVLLLVAVVVAVIAYLAFSSIGNALVYYLTPTELLARGDEAIGLDVRLGGQVKAGSVSQDGAFHSFVLTDGTSEITVISGTIPPQSFREGSGAVVQGELIIDGVFEASEVIVKHDETYVAPSPGGHPSDRVFDPGDE